MDGTALQWCNREVGTGSICCPEGLFAIYSFPLQSKPAVKQLPRGQRRWLGTQKVSQMSVLRSLKKDLLSILFLSRRVFLIPSHPTLSYPYPFLPCSSSSTQSVDNVLDLFWL